MTIPDSLEDMPVTRDLAAFDQQSGSRLERTIFNRRVWVLAISVVLTVVLGLFALRLDLNVNFEKMIPGAHPYVRNYQDNKADLKGLGNSVRIAVENTRGDIFDRAYLDTLKRVNDEVFFIPGVDRASMRSIWTPAVRWTEFTEDGFAGGPVVPDTYDGSAASIEELRANIAKSGEIGSLVANNFRSAIIFAPLLDFDPRTGQALDYREFSRNLETLVRDKYRSENVRVHVVGFAKVAGDLLDGMVNVLAFFGGAIVIAGVCLYGYTRCLRSTLLPVTCSLVAVVWQLGLLGLLGLQLDPYSILVPFLIFAIGMSHGAQKMNGIMQDIARGTHRLVAARYTFRRLFAAGLTALVCDAIGFAVLMLIDVRAIHDLAVAASIGVALLVFTNLVLLPVLLSYTGVDAGAAQRSLREFVADRPTPVSAFLTRFTETRWAVATIAVAALMGGLGFLYAGNLKIGDLDAGAPELRSGSRYNRDNAYIAENYSASSDIFVVMVKTPRDGCSRYETLAITDALEWELMHVAGVQSVTSLVSFARLSASGLNEGSLKHFTLSRNQGAIDFAVTNAPPSMFKADCTLFPVLVYLQDHKADTLTRVVDAVERFKALHHEQEVTFLLAAGNAGLEAATNIVVAKAQREMLLWVYAAVCLLCFYTFRSWRAVVVAILPLVLTSILCEVLMVWLGIGVKVATLPVIALGVGIGVDYALYILSVALAHLRQGETLAAAYLHALRFTGRVVGFTGMTLALGVATWAFSPIKFQADMGILLTFMFLWNMIGALILVPALARFLLGDGRKRSAVAADAPDDLADGNCKKVPQGVG